MVSGADGLALKREEQGVVRGGWSRHLHEVLVVLTGGYAVAGCAVTMVGWAADLERLTSWDGSGIAMFPNTALCGALCGLGLLMHARWGARVRWAVRVVGGLAALVAVLTLFQHATEKNLGIDTLLLKRTWGQKAAAAPMRMGLPASVSYFLLGAGLIGLTGGRGPALRRGVVAIGLFVMLLTAISLTGYMYGAALMYSIPRLTGIAMQTATVLAALGAGLVGSVRERQPMRGLLALSSGGMLTRRLLPAVVLCPLALGYVRVQAQAAGLVDTAFGTSMRTVIELVLMAGMVWWAAAMVDAREREIKKARDEAQAANAAKDQFLAALSHELRTPLMPVLLTVSLLEKNEKLPGEVKGEVEMIRRSVELEARLIDDLLDVTRITSGKLPLQLGEVDVHSILRSAYEITCREADLKTTMDLRASRHWVKGDASRLHQILWNLLSNARKFTPARGALVIRTRDGDGERIVVEVKDTGIGIDAGVMPALFKAFEQGDTEVTRKFGGLGLGLAIAKMLAEAHGGTLAAASEGKGKGATFTLTLPTAEHVEVPPVEKRMGGEGRHIRLRILLVEDHRATRDALVKLLKIGGHAVSTAESVRMALEVAAHGEFDLLLSDVGLPDGTGHDVMRALKDRPGLRGVALSGYGMEEDVRKSREAGFAEHLTKPVDLQKLEGVLRRVFG